MPSVAQNVMFIPAKKQVGTQKTTEKIQKVRVAAYCRVSTENEEQETSYETQVEHYTTYINANPAWEFAGIYADDGISGTNTKKRDEFNRMIADCEAGKIDRILTKSISRFSRNTVDCLKYTRHLKEMNIAVYFEKENIDTLDAKGEVLMTIMAALAQQESESLSANVRLGLQFRNQQGKVQVNHNRFLGYTKDEEGKLIIVPEEAAVVKRIYAEYMEGKSLLAIKRGLEADGIKNGAGNTRWWETNIQQILTNEKYIGDALLQKTYTVSILEKKREKNNGVLPKYYVEGCHEAIIDKDVFLRVREEMTRRANNIGGGKRVYSGKYALSTLVCCGHCGDLYRRVHWNNHGYKSIVWRCVSRLEKDAPDCPARTIREDDLQNAVVAAINQLYTAKDTFLPEFIEGVKSVVCGDLEDRLNEIDELLKLKQTELLSCGRDEKKADGLAEKITRLRSERQEVLTKAAISRDFRERIQEMIDFLNEQPCKVEEYTEELTRKLIKKITINDTNLVVEFKAGAEITIEA